MTRLALTPGPEIASGNARRTIRVGIVIDAFRQPRWVERVISEIARSGVAAISLVVKMNLRRDRATAIREALRPLNELFYSCYSRIDRFLCGTAADAFAPVDLTSFILRYPVMTASAEANLECGELSDADVEEIDSYDLDVLLNFSGRTLEGRILDTARHGVWSYGDGPVLTGLWEVLEGSLVTGVALKVQTAGSPQARILDRSFAATDRHSAYRNRSNCYWKAPAFIVRKLRELSEETTLVPMAQPVCGTPANRPGNLTAIPAVCRLSASCVIERVGKAFHFDQWTIGYRVDGELPLLSRAFGEFQPLIPPKDRTWSDPFAWKAHGRRFVFLREKIIQRSKAHISVLEVNGDGTAGVPVKVLETEDHISYPFLFEWRGDLFMLPGMPARRSIELYRAKKFPFVWEHFGTLMNGLGAANTTLCEVDGRWWMFTSLPQEGALNGDELYLFHADSPLGPWKPHHRNPVKSDVRSARPAGRLFEFEDELYRPAQDGSGFYGSAIVIQRVEALSPSEYREKEVSRITPHWRDDLISTRTFNFFDEVTVVDMKLRRRRLG